jgi:DNA-binding response OmpR family regulator
MAKKLLLVGEAKDGVAQHLAEAGFEVTRAATDGEAAGMIDGYVPDLILLDGIDGPGALAGRGIPIVLITEHLSRGPGGTSRRNRGFRGVIYKPCRPRTLVEGVENVLRYDR